MNLTNLFNLNFLKENMKRSRAVILLLVFLIPVINVIYYLMNIPMYGTLIPGIMDLQPLSLFGIYIMPVILSITLFSFIYKRKSSDFVMSFPVSKKQIFLSNTLGGIIVIIAMNLVNYLFTLIATLLVDHLVLLDYGMLFDMFWLWIVSYIFVFVCTNIAVSVSSNKITTVVVTLLVLFLVPFVHTFITSNSFKGTSNSDIYTYCDNETCKPTNYKCYSTSCEINKRNNLYIYTYYDEVETNDNYTMPYALIYETVMGANTTKINSSILKMTFLSVLYIIIGLLLFTRKKFEVVETSFKSERMHIFVRSLTTIPIICIYYIILINSSITFSDIFTITFLVVLLITYIIIYDLLTRKKVTNILKSLAALIIVGIIVIFTGELSSKEVEQIDVNDITKITFIDSDMVNSNGYTTNKDLINYIISIHIDNVKGEENYYRNFKVRINVEKKMYEFRISTTKEQYNHIINTLTADETYQNSSSKIKNKDIFAIELRGDGSYISKKSELYNKIVEEFQNSTTIETENTNTIFTAQMYIYDNFEVKIFNINITNTKLQEEILNHYNSEVKKTFEDPNVNIHTYYIGEYDFETYTVSEDYLSTYYQNENIEINNFVLDNLDEKVDITKPYKYIKFYTDNYHKSANIFITNKVEELETLVEEIKQKEQEDYNIGDTYDKYAY